MPSFFSLPIEIRFQIYRCLRSFESPIIKSPLMDESNAFGYCSFAFQSRILETSHQVCREAKEVFYGENYWTFFASQHNRFDSMLFQVEPMVLILPFIRKAHIRFSMFHWLFWASCGLQQSLYEDIIKANVREICRVLLTASALRTVKIIWTESTLWWSGYSRAHLDNVQSLVLEVLRPLIGLPQTSELQKSYIMVKFGDGVVATGMELDFSECVDEVIALHRSIKAH